MTTPFDFIVVRLFFGWYCSYLLRISRIHVVFSILYKKSSWSYAFFGCSYAVAQPLHPFRRDCRGALDIFAQFFVSPLFSESNTERELKAVDSEDSKNRINDSRRILQVLRR